jgi:hypothetical protein
VLVGGVMTVFIATMVYLRQGDYFDIRSFGLVKFFLQLDGGSLKVLRGHVFCLHLLPLPTL